MTVATKLLVRGKAEPTAKPLTDDAPLAPNPVAPPLPRAAQERLSLGVL